MLHRSKSRLAVAAAAGTVCALVAAGAAMAGPTPPWSKHNPAVPDAFTNTTPALSQIQVNGRLGTFLAWKGQVDNKVQYKYRLNGTWHATKVIPGAYTNTSPSAALFATKLGKQAVLVAWKSIGKTGGLSAIKYSDGVVANNGSIKLDQAARYARRQVLRDLGFAGRVVPGQRHQPACHRRLPRSLRPRADRDRHRDRHCRAQLQLGHQEGQVSLGQRHRHDGETSAQPALAEILSADGNGTVYVFWKGNGDGRTDLLRHHPECGRSRSGRRRNADLVDAGTVPDGAKAIAQTTGSPAVASADIHGDGPLLLAYKGPGGFYIRYQTLSSGAWSAAPVRRRQQQHHGLGPALVHGTLANVSRTDARIFLHHYLAG